MSKTPKPADTAAPGETAKPAPHGGESLLGDILLEEVVEALDAARNTQPVITPPLPHDARPGDHGAASPKTGTGHDEVAHKRPERPSHRARGD